MFQTKLVQKIKTHFVTNNFFFNRALYEKMEKIEPDRSQTAIWGLGVARWVPKGYVILNAFPLLQWLHVRAAMLRYTYMACLVIFYVTDRQADGHK
jgi:hypothetical protein